MLRGDQAGDIDRSSQAMKLTCPGKALAAENKEMLGFNWSNSALKGALDQLPHVLHKDQYFLLALSSAASYFILLPATVLLFLASIVTTVLLKNNMFYIENHAKVIFLMGLHLKPTLIQHITVSAMVTNTSSYGR